MSSLSVPLELPPTDGNEGVQAGGRAGYNIVKVRSDAPNGRGLDGAQGIQARGRDGYNSVEVSAVSGVVETPEARGHGGYNCEPWGDIMMLPL
ncbi:hypothetical protein DFH09DRAFT_1315132 [Mycena vulgaris]|nr:hypothetical protein DFH09DRAFT_1315132 [Mycena vulgaris]